MDLDVTDLVNAHLGIPPETVLPDFTPCECSASEAEGHTAQSTWGNAKRTAEEFLQILDTGEKQQAARDHFKTYGAWDAEEIAAWDINELTALIVQEVANAIRHLEEHHDLDLTDFTEEEFAAATENEGGNFFQGDIEGSNGYGRWFFYLGI